jgi:hypothetical protein
LSNCIGNAPVKRDNQQRSVQNKLNVQKEKKKEGEDEEKTSGLQYKQV